MRIQFKALQRVVAMLALALVGFVSVGASAAHAFSDDFIFGSTFSGYSRQLVLNGGATVLNATNSGWVRDDGQDSLPGNTNYIVGDCANCGNHNFHDFFTFDLTGVTGPITSATLNIFNPNSGFTGATKDFVVHDVTSFGSALTSGPGSVALYNAIASANVLGSTTVTSAANNNTVVVTLNSFALAVLNALEGQGSFAAGGTIGVSSVPLPAGLPMFAFAVLAMLAVAQLKKNRQFA